MAKKDKFKVEKKAYPADTEISEENAAVETVKALREIRNYYRLMTYTDAGRQRVTAFTRGGVLEQIKGLIQELVYVTKGKAVNQQIQKNVERKQEVTSKDAQT